MYNDGETGAREKDNSIKPEAQPAVWPNCLCSVILLLCCAIREIDWSLYKTVIDIDSTSLTIIACVRMNVWLHVLANHPTTMLTLHV